MIDLYDTDDVTELTGQTLSVNFGSESTPLAFHAWLTKGITGTVLNELELEVAIEEPVDSGTYVTASVPALDGYWFQARWTGSANPSNQTGFEQETTDWTPLGTNARLRGKPMLGNTARYGEIKLVPVGLAGAATVSGRRFKVRTRYDERMTGVSEGVTQVGAGILTGLGDRRFSGWERAARITANSPADDKANVSVCRFVDRGVKRANGKTVSITLNQNDGAAAALTSGQAYIAVITQPLAGGDAVATKGVKAASASAVAPAMPADSLYIGRVRVSYGAGGSVIATADITSSAVDGRFLPTAGTGLNLTVGAGLPGAVIGGGLVVSAASSTVALTASVTNQVWLGASGAYTATTSTVPPTSGAEWIATATCDGSGITALTDRRKLNRNGALALTMVVAPGNEATGTDVARVWVPWRASIDSVILAVRTASTGATGSTIADVNRSSGGTAATIFTDQGATVESRPYISAQGYVSAESYPDVTELEAGDWLSLDIDAITSGGTRAADIVCIVVIYPR